MRIFRNGRGDARPRQSQSPNTNTNPHSMHPPTLKRACSHEAEKHMGLICGYKKKSIKHQTDPTIFNIFLASHYLYRHLLVGPWLNPYLHALYTRVYNIIIIFHSVAVSVNCQRGNSKISYVETKPNEMNEWIHWDPKPKAKTKTKTLCFSHRLTFLSFSSLSLSHTKHKKLWKLSTQKPLKLSPIQNPTITTTLRQLLLLLFFIFSKIKKRK